MDPQYFVINRLFPSTDYQLVVMRLFAEFPLKAFEDAYELFTSTRSKFLHAFWKLCLFYPKDWKILITKNFKVIFLILSWWNFDIEKLKIATPKEMRT